MRPSPRLPKKLLLLLAAALRVPKPAYTWRVREVTKRLLAQAYVSSSCGIRKTRSPEHLWRGYAIRASVTNHSPFVKKSSNTRLCGDALEVCARPYRGAAATRLDVAAGFSAVALAVLGAVPPSCKPHV